ncbi:MAG: chorismate synthase [Nannocystaceae bacterium]
MSNSFGTLFRVTTFGESHGGGLGVVIDGCPAGLTFPHEQVAAQLARRRPGQGTLTSARREPDQYEVVSGLEPESGKTLGTSLTLLFRNKDARSRSYKELEQAYRPSHADYTYDARYGLRAVSGGGRASARETVARVAAGAVAEAFLRAQAGIEIVAWVDDVAGIKATVNSDSVTREAVDQTPVRCPDENCADAMIAAIEAARRDGDTVGGVVRCVARKVPAGWGAPVFGKLTADLAHALMGLPASRGFEIGEGYGSRLMRGSEHNDPFRIGEDGRVVTTSNHSGGIQGGISNGEAICLSVAFKPVATIFKPQPTVTRDGREVTYQAKGRHDPCVLPRAVPMVEAMVALVLCDHMLRAQVARQSDLKHFGQEPSA